MTVGATTNTTPPTGSSSSSSSTAADLASGASQLNQTYQSFLTLLTAQLQNQDPLSPMDTNTFTQQLVSMNGVQQQLLTNNLLTQLVGQSAGAGSASNLIGKTVTGQSSVQTLANGSATWTYNLPSAAAKATLQVTDSNGNLVWSGSAPSTAAGAANFTWNGQNLAGGTAPAGNYTLTVSATDANGNPITSTVDITGVVTASGSANGVTQVDIGSIPINVSSITYVTTPSSN